MRSCRLLVAAMLLGCGGAPAAGSTTPESRAHAGDDASVPLAEVEGPRERADEEGRELRSELGGPRSVVRIGRRRPAPDGHEPEVIVEEGEDEEVPAEGGRPVLRLHGPARPTSSPVAVAPMPGSAPPPVVPPPPQAAVFGRLPLTGTRDVPAIPDDALVVAPGTTPPPSFVIAPSALPTAAPAATATREARPSTDDAAQERIVEEYRVALAHVEAQRFDEALTSLSRFVATHPEHAYADNALYWQGEVHYLRREYRRAVAVFEQLVARYPSGNKVPDALLRIGVALEQLGERDRARTYFRRVREQFPDSVAARLARREET